jgi:hypothetical protein
MQNIFIQPERETFTAVEEYRGRLLEASKPYLTIFLIVTFLLSLWAALCAA